MHGVDIPVAAVQSILQLQAEWEKDCVSRSTRYCCAGVTKINSHGLFARNEQKKPTRARHEREKEFMGVLQDPRRNPQAVSELGVRHTHFNMLSLYINFLTHYITSFDSYSSYCNSYAAAMCGHYITDL